MNSAVIVPEKAVSTHFQPEAFGRGRETHSGLCDGHRDFCMQDGMPGIIQGRMNVCSRQFRVALEQRIPGFIVCQLFKDRGHRNPCASDERLASTHARVDFNAFVPGVGALGVIWWNSGVNWNPWICVALAGLWMILGL